MNDALIFEGIRLAIRVGVPEEERSQPQEVIVRLEIATDLEAAGKSDALEDTIDYAAVLTAVERALSERSFALLEHAAERITMAVSAFKGVGGVSVEIEKVDPPVPQSVGRIAVRIER